MKINANKTPTPAWQQSIWLGLGAALVGLIVLMFGLVGWTQWRVLDVIGSQTGDPAFVAASLGLSNVVLLRFLAALIGGAISFAGLAVSFFAHEQATVFKIGQSENVQLPSAQPSGAIVPRLGLTSHSPGIIAIFVGAAIIMSALFATSRSGYKGPTTVNVVSGDASIQPGGHKSTNDGSLNGAVTPEQLDSK